MKTSSWILLLGTLALSLGAAGAEPKSEVKDAIKKLGTQASYSWTFTPKTEGSEAAARQGPIQGKTEKDGITWLKGTAGEISFEAWNEHAGRERTPILGPRGGHFGLG